MRRCLNRCVFAAIVLLALVACVVGLRRQILTRIGEFLVVTDLPRPAGAIVVLSGSIPDRILEAVDLYRAGLAPRIVLTREGPLPGLDELRARGGDIPEHHELNEQIAAQLGVPRSALSVLRPPVWSTRTEAEAVGEFLLREGIHTVLLVTSKAHSRRAAMTFRDLAAGRLEFVICPSRYDPFRPDGWWQRRPHVRRVVIEYLKMLNFVLVDRWRRVPLPATG